LLKIFKYNNKVILTLCIYDIAIILCMVYNKYGDKWHDLG